MKSFEDIAAAMGNLPTLPTVVSRVLRVVEDTDSSADDLVAIIQNDQAIAGKVLKVANSAYYGLRRQVKSIGHAVVLLGFETVRNLCLGIGVFRSFLPYGLHQQLDVERFWEHTIATAICARMIWKDQSRDGQEEVFLCGLIHDIGRLAFLAGDPRGYSAMIRKARRTATPMVTIEQDAFGGTHAELGAMLCERWSFNAELQEPIRHHHDLAACDEVHADRTAGVMLGNYLSHERRVGWAVDTAVAEMPVDALKRLEMTREQAEGLGDRLEHRRAEIESFTAAFM